jgi:NAD(P)-dependent dehydrogenase (short-subunit alcohol dehydrogenase family)
MPTIRPHPSHLIAGLLVLLWAFCPWAAAQGTFDMKGRTALVTGSTSGLGETVARRLGAMGATVIVHGLNEPRGQEIAAEISRKGPGRAVYYPGNLGSLDEVAALARRVRTEHPTLHLLVNNAGILAGNDTRRVSADGYELTFAVNHLAHFALTGLLLDQLDDGSRIVNVSSIGQAPVDFDDIGFEQGYDAYTAYARSKLAQVLFTVELAGRLGGSGPTVNALHPATLMDTKMVRQAFGRSQRGVEEGVDATLRLAADPELDGVSGRFFDGTSESRAQPQAYDAEARRRLWTISEELTGVRLPG